MLLFYLVGARHCKAIEESYKILRKAAIKYKDYISDPHL